MMKKAALKGAQTGYAARSGKSLSDFYKKQTNNLIGNEFDNIKALQLRSIIQRSTDKKAGFNEEMAESLYREYEADIDSLTMSGKFTQEQGNQIKNNSRRMFNSFKQNPNANTNAFMQGWRLDGMFKSIENIALQNREVLSARKGVSKDFRGEEMFGKIDAITKEIFNLKETLNSKKGGALKRVEIERLETLIKDLEADLPKHQGEQLKGFINDIKTGSHRVSVIDSFKDISDSKLAKRISRYISYS
jgi:hypothetical protein